MILGMMQPYFYPYLGYWQLMNYVDEYIIYDDVNFIKGGWIHRNRIKVNGEAQYFGIAIKKPSQNKKICEHTMNMTDKTREDLLKKIECSYGRAPYFKDAMEVVRDTIMCDKENLAEFLAYSNRKIAEYLGITTPIYTCTELKLDHTNGGQQRIIDICKARGYDVYINAIGGKELYNEEDFAKEGIKLGFLRMDSDIEYPQGKNSYIQGLSILDVMMYNSKDEISKLLNRFTLE